MEVAINNNIYQQASACAQQQGPIINIWRKSTNDTPFS